MFLQRISFRIKVDPKESQCVPKTGVEVIDQQKYVQDTLGITLEPPLPDIHIDHGIPTFALCGKVQLTAGPKVLCGTCSTAA